MKKVISVLLLSLLAAVCVQVSAAAPQDIIGTWEGWYYAAQGQTGAKFTFYEEDGEVVGIEELYSMPGMSNVPDQTLSVTVEVEDGEYVVTETGWIENRPSGWSLGVLYLTVEDSALVGNVNGVSSNTVYLLKDTAEYTQVSDSVYDNHRYEVISDKMTWERAREYCEEQGGHLVSINSEGEQRFIESLLKASELRESDDVWIGTSRELNEFKTWVTGEPVDYSLWGYPQPDNLGGSQNYAVIVNGGRGSEGGSYYIKQYEWDDNSNSSRAFVCEWESWSEAAEWSTPELQRAAEYDLIPDVLVGKDMTQPITRGEFAAVSVKLFESMTGGRAVMSSECGFRDIENNENRNYILKAYNIGAVNGVSDTEYAPNDLLQREQLAAMLCRVYKKSEWPEWTLETDDNYTINYSGVQKFADDELISDYAKPSVYFMVKYGVLSGVGDNKFAPKNSTPAEEAEGYANATREQAIAMSLRSFENLQ